MALEPNTPITDIRIDKVFIGSCTNSRIEDLREAAAVVRRSARASRRNIKLAMVVPGSGLVKEQAEREGLDTRLHGRRLRMARAGLLDVPRDERRPARAGRALRLDVATATSKAARAPAAARIWSAPRWPPRRRSKAISSTCAARAELTRRHGTVSRPHRPRRAARPRERRHRRHHPQAVPEVDQALGLRPEPVRRVALSRPRRARAGPGDAAAQSRLRAQPAALPGRVDPARAQELRLRLARASTRRGRSQQYGFRAIIAPSYADIFFNNCFKNGLLPIVLPETQVDRLFDDVAAFLGYRLTIDLERAGRGHAATAATLAFEVEPFRKYCLLERLRRHRPHAAPRRQDPRVRGRAPAEAALARDDVR